MPGDTLTIADLLRAKELMKRQGDIAWGCLDGAGHRSDAAYPGLGQCAGDNVGCPIFCADCGQFMRIQFGVPFETFKRFRRHYRL